MATSGDVIEIPEWAIDAYERLLRHVEEDEHGCWIWKGATRAGGRYGTIRAYIDGQWRLVSTHHVAYVRHNGVLAPKHVVRHGCDVSLCCFYCHLVSGTQTENVRDMMERGRGKGQFQPKKEYDGKPHPNIPF